MGDPAGTRTGAGDMICAICGQEARSEAIWYVHPNGSRYGDDGHQIVPITGGSEHREPVTT